MEQAFDRAFHVFQTLGLMVLKEDSEKICLWAARGVGLGINLN